MFNLAPRRRTALPSFCAHIRDIASTRLSEPSGTLLKVVSQVQVNVRFEVSQKRGLDMFDFASKVQRRVRGALVRAETEVISVAKAKESECHP